MEKYLILLALSFSFQSQSKSNVDIFISKDIGKILNRNDNAYGYSRMKEKHKCCNSLFKSNKMSISVLQAITAILCFTF